MGMLQRLFARHSAKKLGVTKESVVDILTSMDAERPIDDGRPAEVLALDVMTRVRVANDAAWCEADGDGFDWSGLLEFISQLIAILMPLIIKRRQPV